MPKTIIAAAVAASLALGGAVAWNAHAAPPPDGGPDAMADGRLGGPHDMHGMHGMYGMHGHWRHLFALVAAQPDRNLTPADVQTIASAFLLWKGNHSWKVTEVKDNGDQTIGFAYATANGDVIARFKMDRHTGHLDRVS